MDKYGSRERRLLERIEREIRHGGADRVEIARFDLFRLTLFREAVRVLRVWASRRGIKVLSVGGFIPREYPDRRRAVAIRLVLEAEPAGPGGLRDIERVLRDPEPGLENSGVFEGGDPERPECI